jgi:Holliday junction resolvasome RuvABC endonuclease subunit
LSRILGIDSGLRITGWGISDKASVLNEGNVVRTGHTREMETCGNEFVKNFIGPLT